MILVYPLGVPAYFFYLLYSNREEVKKYLYLKMDESMDDYNKNRGITDEKAAQKSKNPTKSETPDAKVDEGVNKPRKPRRMSVNPLDILRSTSDVTTEKDDTASKNESDTLEEEEGEFDVEAVDFLMGGYEPKYYYWEVVETYRRLVLTSVIAVVATGSSSQGVLSMIVGILFMKLYAYCAPYVIDEEDILAELGQYQVFFTLFGTLIIQNELCGKGSNPAVAACLVLVNLILPTATSYF